MDFGADVLRARRSRIFWCHEFRIPLAPGFSRVTRTNQCFQPLQRLQRFTEAGKPPKRALSARGAHAPRVRPAAPRGRERRAPSRVVRRAGSTPCAVARTGAVDGASTAAREARALPKKIDRHDSRTRRTPIAPRQTHPPTRIPASCVRQLSRNLPHVMNNVRISAPPKVQLVSVSSGVSKNASNLPCGDST